MISFIGMEDAKSANSKHHLIDTVDTRNHLSRYSNCKGGDTQRENRSVTLLAMLCTCAQCISRFIRGVAKTNYSGFHKSTRLRQFEKSLRDAGFIRGKRTEDRG